MTTGTVETPVQAPEQPIPVAPVVDAPAEDDSLASHEASYGKPVETEDEADTAPAEIDREKKTGKFAPRHRAASQKATPADVPRIQELTRKLREAEAEVTRLRTPAAPVGITPNSQLPTSNVAAPAAVAPLSAKPSWKDYEAKLGEPGGYETWSDMQDAYDDARDAWKEQQALTTSRASQLTHAESATTAAREAIKAEYDAKAAEFAKTRPDFYTKLQASLGERFKEHVPKLLFHAILTDDNGPEIMYHFATHPDEYDEFVLDAVRLPETDASVALLQRRLTKARTQAVSTGSAAPFQQHPQVPRPPNPVRTGPMSTGDELPGDESTLAEHEKAYSRKRRQ